MHIIICAFRNKVKYGIISMPPRSPKRFLRSGSLDKNVYTQYIMGEIQTGIHESKGIHRWVLNLETHDSFGGLQTAIERSKQGVGIAVFCSHNMKSDMVAALLMLKKIPEFKNKEFVLPINSMLYKKYWPSESLLNITLVPVHSPEVRRLHAMAKDRQSRKKMSLMDRVTVPKEEFLDVETSLQKYLAALKRALEHGGVVLVAPQAQGNMDTLDMTHQRRAFTKFWTYMNQFPDVKYSVLPIGVSYPKSARLGRPQKGMHVGERMHLEVGNCFSREAVTKAVTDIGGNADLWMYSQIASLLPTEAVRWGSSAQRMSS